MIMLLVTAALMVLTGGTVWLAALRSQTIRDGPKLGSARIQNLVDQHPWLARHARPRPDPASTTGFALTAALAILVVGVTGFGIILFLVRENVGFAHVDTWVGHFAANHADPTSTSVLRVLSQLGGTVVLTTSCVVVALFEARRRRFLAVAGFLLLCVGGQVVVVDLVKGLVNRARPNIDRLTGFSGASFPSGHATAAAAGFAAFALLLGIGHSRRTRAALSGIAAGLAVGVACTRAFLGVHWLTDVLAGLALGWAWFAFCSIAFGGRLLRFGAPVEQAQHSQPLGAGEETHGDPRVRNHPGIGAA